MSKIYSGKPKKNEKKTKTEEISSETFCSIVYCKRWREWLKTLETFDKTVHTGSRQSRAVENNFGSFFFSPPQRFIRIPDSLVWQTDTSRVNLMKSYQSQVVLVCAGSSKYGSFGFNWVPCLQPSSVRSLKMLMSCRKTPPFFIASLINKTALVVPTQAYITNYKQCVMNDT